MNAIILAAGIGERAVPLTYEMPKGLLPVFGEPMIDRQIKQLHEAGVTDITVVSGYMKEKLEYLTVRYGARLVYNPEYAVKNNLASLWLARDALDETYVCVSDNYMTENIFSASESESWIACTYHAGKTDEWVITEKTGSGEILEFQIGGADAHAIQGPAYFTSGYSERFKHYLDIYYHSKAKADCYYEHIIKDELENLPPIHIKDATGILYEFENWEELRAFDPAYNDPSCSSYIRQICKALNIPPEKISGIAPLKDRGGNKSFRFKANGKAYVYNDGEVKRFF